MEKIFTEKNSILTDIARTLNLERKNARLISPLTLAYVGDTVYDLYVRTRLVLTSDATAHNLHVMATKTVCAKAQANAAHRIMELLTEDELYIFKRGRNSHMGTVPKHAEMADYRAATGLEALIGYLYLSGQDERLNEIMAKALLTE